MNVDDRTVRNRWLLIVLTRIATALGSVFGVVLAVRAEGTPTRLLGIALVLAALYAMAVVPQALAHRWRSPPQ